MNKNLLHIIFLGLLLCFNLNAQVTIGSDIPPLKGAILDLKQRQSDGANANSDQGFIIPRVSLTDSVNLYPMLKGTEANYNTLKTEHTGLIVYNTNTTSYFRPGMYLWNSAKWIHLGTITAQNGITQSGDVFELGGTLTKNTTIDLNDKDILINQGAGYIGVGTTSPKASVHINGTAAEPLILENMKYVSDDYNDIDVNNPQYYDVRISNTGVLRKRPPIVQDLNEPVLYNLQKTTRIAVGDNFGNNGSLITWERSGTNHDYIVLPENGAYIFSLRLYGDVSGYGNAGTSFYVSLFRNAATRENLFDIAEITILRSTGYNRATYSINMTVTGKAGDKVYIKMGKVTGGAFDWELKSGGALQANKTSMIFWKL